MSIKDFVKAHSPQMLRPILRASYRAVVWPHRRAKKAVRDWVISHRALSYLPYYKDELSRQILHDRIRYIKTGNVEIFLDRAEKEGWTFSGLYRIDGSPEYSYADEHRQDYSDVTVVYDNEGRYLDYTRKLMAMIYGADGFRCINLEEFLRHPRIIKSSLVVPVMEGKRRPASIREEAQYFDVFSPVDGEVVVDAGAYDGGTALQFLEWGGGKVKQVYSFEFDPVNAEKCRENLKSYSDKVTVISKGTWDKNETLHVNATGGTGSRVSEKGRTEVHLTTIDSVVKDERVTFIKMDVEGAELKSLMGARNTIVNNRPRLAICVYHKPEDLYEIPGYILSLVPEYRFYLRHYSSNEWETVLYASCE